MTIPLRLMDIIMVRVVRRLRISCYIVFFFSSRRRHTRCSRDWSSDVCSSDLGLSFIAAYTWSKTLTDTDSALSASGSQVVQDFYNRKAEKAIASFDFPQFLKLTWIYELPFGHGRKWLNTAGPVDRLVSGWQLTAIQNYSSGDPLVIFSSFSPG